MPSSSWSWSSKRTEAKVRVLETNRNGMVDGDVRVIDYNNTVQAANVRRIVGGTGQVDVERVGNITTATHFSSDVVDGKTVRMFKFGNDTTVTEPGGTAIEYIADKAFGKVEKAFEGVTLEDIGTYSVSTLRHYLKKFSALDPDHVVSRADHSEFDRMEEAELRGYLTTVLKAVNAQRASRLG